MEEVTYSKYPADLSELIEEMQAGRYKHLSIFLYRDKSSLDMGFNQQYLIISRHGFDVYILKSVDYNSGVLQMLFSEPDTECVIELTIDINNEHPEYLAIRWNDIKDMVYDEVVSNYNAADLLELNEE